MEWRYKCNLVVKVFPCRSSMWPRKHSSCSAVSDVSRCEDLDAPNAQLFPFAVALRVRVLQIVCGFGGMVVGAVGWLEEREKIQLGLGVPAGFVTLLASATSVYFSRGFDGWRSARARASNNWGAPWRVLGPSPCAAVPLTLLWMAAVVGHLGMVAFCVRSLVNIGCNSTTCIGVAGAQLAISVTTLVAQVYMVHLDLRYDAALSPLPRHSDAHTCTAVSLVPVASGMVTSGSSDPDVLISGNSPLTNGEREVRSPILKPPI